MSILKRILARINTDWVDITYTPVERLSPMQFSQILFTEQFTPQELKSMYPEVYERYYQTIRESR